MYQPSLEEQELSEDPKFRNYSNAIDKALKTFEYTSEWADLIAALGKLNKVLQSHSKFNIIPRKIIIAKRLAQCLHPALPSGVHLKALETYDLIFKLVGPAKLAGELFIYSTGLYPLLTHAAINVRPVLLRLYEIHLVPIIEFLKPGLSGLLSGILPGLEEGSDHYDQTVVLLDKVCEGVTSSTFYGSLWKCMAENPQIRLPSFIYIIARYDRKRSVDVQLEMLGNNLDVMIQSLCVSLEDTNVLVQRHALEFLLAAFPFHGSHLLKSDLTKLLASSINTLLRRDMSLNRRLFSWILGYEGHNHGTDGSILTASPTTSLLNHGPDHENYFIRYSKIVLIEALHFLLKTSYNSRSCDMRSYRVLTFLLEKPEIGPVILDEVLIDIFRSLYLTNYYSSNMKKKPTDQEELIKMANLLYNILEESYIWSYMSRALRLSAQNSDEGSQVQEVGKGLPSFQEVCKLATFLLNIFPVESSKEMQAQHLPCLLSETSKLLSELRESINCSSILTGLDLCLFLTKKTIPTHEVNDLGLSKMKISNFNQPIEKNNADNATCVNSSTLLLAQNQRKYLTSALSDIQSLLIYIMNGLLGPLNCPLAHDPSYFFVKHPKCNSYESLEKILSVFLGEKEEKFSASFADNISVRTEFNSSLSILSTFSQPKHDLEQLLTILKPCCQMLRELASFPVYLVDGTSHYCGTDCDKNWLDLPIWLQLLCLSCCCLQDQYSSTQLQFHITVASTLLDLTTSTLAILPATFWQTKHTNRTISSYTCSTISSPNNTISIVFLPVITPSHLMILFNSTKVYQLFAERLWEGLKSSNENQQRYVELLYQLHTIAPASLNNVAEEVILRDLSEQFHQPEKVADALGRFTILWQYGRNLDPAKWSCQRLKMFDRCLFLLFDWMSSDIPSAPKATIEGWVVQVLLRSDVSRFLDPLFLLLLKPHSARISIRRVIFDSTKKATESCDKTKDLINEDVVRAISSVNGHVIYHVSPSRIQKRNFNRALMTLGLHADGKAPESYVDRKVAFPWQAPEQYLLDQNMELFVNPFSYENSSIPDKATGLHNEDSKKLSVNSEKSSDTFALVHSLLKELVDNAVDKAYALAAAARCTHKSISPNLEKPAIPDIYDQILLYCQVSDAHQTLHILKILRSLLLINPQLILLNLASTELCSSSSLHSSRIQELLARHTKCLNGDGFHGEISNDQILPHRSNTYLEILLNLLLRLQRSFYSNMGLITLSRDEVISNRKVQLASIDLLRLILTELSPLLKHSGKSLTSLVSDMLIRCRVQKTILHYTATVLHIVTNDKHKQTNMPNERWNSTMQSFISEITSFNEDNNTSNISYFEAALVSLTKLLFSIMALEDQIAKNTDSSGTHVSDEKPSKNDGSERYRKGLLVHSQPLFLSIILSALKQRKSRRLHPVFTRLIVSSLALFGYSLPKILASVVPLICSNLESAFCSAEQEIVKHNYLISELEALTALCLSVISDSPSNLIFLASSVGLSGGSICLMDQSNQSSTPNNHLLQNLVYTFTSDLSTSKTDATTAIDPMTSSRKKILSNLPKILSCAQYLWQMSSNHTTEKTNLLRRKILDLLNPIGHFHGTNLLLSFSAVWAEKNIQPTTNHSSKGKLLPEPTPEQLTLIDLIASLSVLNPDTLIQLLRQIFKLHAQNQTHNRTWRQESALLHFLNCYLRKITKLQLGECWASLLQLLRDLSSLAPPLLFSGLAIFEEALQRFQTPGERRDQRELQEVATKLLEACGTLAAACLEQTTWLRRNLSVKRETLAGTSTGEADMLPTDNLHSLSNEPIVMNDANDISATPTATLSSSCKASRYSIQALIVLSKLLAPLQDLVFPNQDKERVIPLLTSLLANVIPYLKHHSQTNVYGMRAAAEMVSSLSNYPATRRAWRKDTFDLLFDSQFFAVDVETLRHWRNIVDNMMSHDKDALREFLNRISASPSGLFSSRDQELENRTMLLKRLAFVLFATEGDQYQRFLPDILEKLSETQRLYQTWPQMQAQVFLCFRVLLLRLSHQHVISLWPSVISETVQVLSLMEYELQRDSVDCSSQARRLGSQDVANASNVTICGSQSWLQLFSSACKLVHLVLALPASRLPQFQMYRWAFIGDGNSYSESSESHTSSSQAAPHFSPYLSRIYRYLRLKAEISDSSSVPNVSTEIHTISTIGSVKNIGELFPLFQLFENQDNLRVVQEEVVVSSMESLLELDFLESIPP